MPPDASPQLIAALLERGFTRENGDEIKPKAKHA